MKNLQPLSNRIGATPGSSLAHIKTQSLARDEEEKARRMRIKGTVVLIEQFLADQGYGRSLQLLQEESQVSLSEYCAADNIDLITAIHEYEQFYFFKFQKKLKLFRSRAGEEDIKVISEGGEKMLIRKNKSVPVNYAVHLPSSQNTSQDSKKPDGQRINDNSASPLSKLRVPGKKKQGSDPSSGGDGIGLNVEGVKVVATHGENAAESGGTEDFFSRALQPMPFFHNSELRELAETILREILDTNPSVKWDDITELHHAKQLLKEAVVMPVKYPELFEGIVRPWKGILLFGPPGTGKTLLAKAVATECRTTFFNISASSVVSKWRGDSEKLIRMLFDLAVHYAPSTIFIDEIDSLISSRASQGEHEASRRMKTELLMQMDGLSKRKGGEIVFVLAATNVPWDLDAAMLRRLEKRVLVTLPTYTSRREMFYRLLHDRVKDPRNFDWDTCARETDLLSGADINTLCREAIMRPIRKCIEELERKNLSMDVLSQQTFEKPKVSLEDVEASISCTRSSVRASDLKKYEKWMDLYGSGMST